MKVAFITHLCPHYRYRLFTMLSDDHGFDFFFFDDESRTREDVIHLKIIKDDNKFHYIFPRGIFGSILKNKYSAIIKCTNNKWSFLMSFLATKSTNAKFIVWHTIWYYPRTMQYRLFSWLLIKILKDYSDAIVVYGGHGKNFLEQKGIIPEKIFIAWQTVDNKLFGQKISNERMRDFKEKLNLTSDKKIILFVGRISEIKGIRYLLDALNRIKKSKFILLTIGNGDLVEYMKDYCEKNGIELKHLGLISNDELPQFYKAATMLVLPSITTKNFKEPWGLVVNEAFNQGCPVVITDAVGAGAGGLVSDGINGLIVPEGNSIRLAEAIWKLLSDDGFREILSKNASEEIKKWNYERQSQGFLEAVTYALSKD